MKTTDFEKDDLFKFLNKKEQKGKTFRVQAVSDDWMQCRIPNPPDKIEEGEARFSFSNDYLQDAKIQKLGKGVEPPKPKVYSKPRRKPKMPGLVKPRRKKNVQ